jgi:hypothetical protein
MQDLQDREVVTKLFDHARAALFIAAGGYTRLLRVGFRKGDSAEIAQVELVGSEFDPRAKTEEGKARRAPSRRPRASAAVCGPRRSACVGARRPMQALPANRRLQPKPRPSSARLDASLPPAARSAGVRRESRNLQFTIVNCEFVRPRGSKDLRGFSYFRTVNTRSSRGLPPGAGVVRGTAWWCMAAVCASRAR